MDSIEKVGKICRDILELTDEDFQAVDNLAKEQADYMHPFKNGKAKKLHEISNHNQKTLAAIQILQQVLIDGAPVNG